MRAKIDAAEKAYTQHLKKRACQAAVGICEHLSAEAFNSITRQFRESAPQKETKRKQDKRQGNKNTTNTRLV